MHGRILVIDQKVPEPDQDSGSASTFSYLQILARAGYEVIFAPHNFAPRPAV
jgi:O-antigen biosynthesis protein